MLSVSKKCGTCKNTKDVSEFYKHRRESDGLQSSCKECCMKPKSTLPRMWRGKLINGAFKICGACKISKKRDEFYKNKYQSGGLRALCINCVRIESKKRNEPGGYFKSERGRVARHKAIKKSYEKFPEKWRARAKFKYAIKTGKITRPEFCENFSLSSVKCSEGVVHGHHEDYSKPLDVRWLCRSCHNKVHFPNLLPIH